MPYGVLMSQDVVCNADGFWIQGRTRWKYLLMIE